MMLASNGERGDPCGVPSVVLTLMPVGHDSGAQIRPDELQDTLVPHFSGDARHQGIVVDPIEERVEVDVYDPVAALLDEALGGGDRHVSRTLGPKSEAHLGEVRVETGVSTCSNACWMRRSITVGTPSIRLPPSALGMETRRRGCGR
jgi:hypothetical protein